MPAAHLPSGIFCALIKQYAPAKEYYFSPVYYDHVRAHLLHYVYEYKRSKFYLHITGAAEKGN